MIDYPYTPETDMSDGVAVVFYLVYMLVMLAVSVGSYVFQSISYYSIAKRRGIKKPWLSWIPVGNMWILGCISDQYQYVVKGRVKNKRKTMLILNILMSVAYIILYVVFGAFLVQMLYYDDSMLAVDHAVMLNMLGTAVGMLGVGLIVMGLCIAIVVIQYIALYDLYTSCDPKNNVLYLVLSIFFNITLPIFVFICRGKDLGMPPRRPEPAAYIPQHPLWQPTQEQPQQTIWQNTEPPKDPWENNPEE